MKLKQIILIAFFTLGTLGIVEFLSLVMAVDVFVGHITMPHKLSAWAVLVTLNSTVYALLIIMFFYGLKAIREQAQREKSLQ